MNDIPTRVELPQPITFESTDPDTGKWCLVHVVSYLGCGKWAAHDEDWQNDIVVDSRNLKNPTMPAATRMDWVDHETEF